MRIIQTTRFGDIQVDDHRVLLFPEGLLGFGNFKQYILIQHSEDSAFFWMQSADFPDLAFVVVDPFLIKPDYLQNLNSQDQELFADYTPESMQICILVTIPPDNVQAMTANLLGPLVIDVRTRIGRQLILTDPSYSSNHPII